MKLFTILKCVENFVSLKFSRMTGKCSHCFKIKVFEKELEATKAIPFCAKREQVSSDNSLKGRFHAVRFHGLKERWHRSTLFLLLSLCSNVNQKKF
jgi:hypothetical protein